MQMGLAHGSKATAQCNRILREFADEVGSFEREVVDIEMCDKALFESRLDDFRATRKLFDLQFLRILQQVQCPNPFLSKNLRALRGGHCSEGV